jgi:hypothetical protein
MEQQEGPEMTTTAYLFPAEGNPTLVHLAAETIELEDLRKYTKAEYVDRVPLGASIDMWVDDEGLLNDLPVNSVASRFVNGTIVGDVLVCAISAGGDAVGLSYKQLRMVEQRLADIGESAS